MYCRVAGPSEHAQNLPPSLLLRFRQSFLMREEFIFTLCLPISEIFTLVTIAPNRLGKMVLYRVEFSRANVSEFWEKAVEKIRYFVHVSRL